MSESQRYTRPGAMTASGAPCGEHGADLHRRGVRAQQPPVGEIESVVHRPRRMIGRDVQRLEVVEVVLDFRTRGDLEAGAPEERLDAQARLRDRMQPAALPRRAGQGDIDAPGGQLRLDGRRARGARAAPRGPPAPAPWPR